jgi:hypothetical protein
MIGAILGLIPAIILAIILFLINPILGVIWVLWLVGVTIFTLKRNKGN